MADLTVSVRRWAELQRQRARSRVRQALKAGTLTKGPCRYAAGGDCNGQIEAHHHLGYDDAHWLDVEWYCHRHHGLQHRLNWGKRP